MKKQFKANWNLTCPKCEMPEKGNVKQEDLVLCSRCLMRKAVALEQAEKRAKEEGKALPHEKAIRRPAVKGTFPNPKIVCKKCGGGFRPRSNRQEYCPPCGKVVRDQSNRENQKKRLTESKKAQTTQLGV